MQQEEIVTQKKPLDYLMIVFRRKWLVVIPTVIGIVLGIIACNVLPKMYQSSTLILVEEGRVINPLIKGLAVSTSVKQRLAILREQILGWDRINQLIATLNLAGHVKTQQEYEGLVRELRSNIRVRLQGPNIVGISYIGEDPVQAMNIVKTITDIFIAENLKQQDSETENAIDFINDQLALYQKKLKQAEVAGMEDKLNDLLVDSTEKHPMVIQLKKQIVSAKREIDEGNYNLKESNIPETDKEMVTLKKELRQLRDEIATSALDAEEGGANRSRLASTTNDQLYKLLLLDKVNDVTSRDQGVNESLYNELLKRLETAKLTQRLEASREGTRYTILDPARLPLKPVKPNKPMVLFMGMFFGLCCGGAMLFMAEMFDHSFISVEEAKSYLELPIFGAVSRIITKGDLRAQKIRNIKVASLSTLVGVALIVVIIFNVFLGS